MTLKMKSAKGSSCSFTKPWTHAPVPAGSQYCEGEQLYTDGGTSSSVGDVSFVDEQIAGFKTSPLKVEPEEQDNLCGESSSSVGYIIENTEFLKDPIKVEDSEDKDYLYCEDCKAFFINKCEVHGPALFIPDTPVSLGVTDRARLTLPPGLEIRESSIPHAGLGVFNEGETVPVGAHFGPYQGELVDREEAMNSGYSWVIIKSRMYEEYIDAKREAHANWMRYVNCAHIDEEKNLVAFQYRGEILYRCCRPIKPGQELLVWYEEEYAKNLSAVFDYLWNKKCSPNEVNNSLLHVSSCSLCPLSYTSQKSLHRHMRRCHNEQHVKLTEPITVPNLTATISCSDQQTSSGTLLTSNPEQQLQKELHNCLDCGKSFPHQSALQTHQLIHTGEKPYQCSQCGKNFNKKCNLKKHLRIHTGEKPYLCTHCGKGFAHWRYFKVHQRIHTGEKPYQCSQCGKSFTAKGNLRAHQLIHAGEKPYCCSQCGKGFTEMRYLQAHQRIHTGEKPHHCSECGKFFAYPSSFKRHQRICKGQKLYFCSQCGKGFTEQCNFQTHQLVHTTVKLYLCSHCGKGFAKKRFLQIHERIHREKPHQCSHCGEDFIEKHKLQAHQRTHTEEKPYHCSQCGRGFIEEHNLLTHERMHIEENPYRCLQCGKSFTDESSLQTHQCTHRGEKLYQCSHCGESLTNQRDVQLHQRVHQWRLAKLGPIGH